MSLQDAKAKLEEQNKVAAIFQQPTTTKVKKTKLPLQRDVYVIEQLINNEIRKKENEIDNMIMKNAETKYQTEINTIHQKAILLKQEILALSRKIERESNGTLEAIKDGGYSSNYTGALPDDIDEAKDTKLFHRDRTEAKIIKELKQEAEDLICNIKVGFAPFEDAKKLIDKIKTITI